MPINKWNESSQSWIEIDEDGRPTVQPSMVEQVIEYTAAYSRWMIKGFPTRTQEEIDEVHKICATNQCGYFRGDQCARCACGVVHEQNMKNKLYMATESCPEGLWPAKVL